MRLTSGQKKALGITIVIVFSIVEVFLLITIVLTFDTYDEGIAEAVLSLLFTMGIFFFPVWWGFSTWKSAEGYSAAQAPPLPPGGSIKIQTKVDLSAYRKLLFLITYKHPAVIFLHLIAVSIGTFYVLGKIRGEATGTWFVLFFDLLVLYLPFGLYFSATRNYNATKCLHEMVSYEFTPDAIISQGESFNSTIQWRSLHKIRETRECVLLYTNNVVAMIIPKKAFASEEELKLFRRMCRIG